MSNRSALRTTSTNTGLRLGARLLAVCALGVASCVTGSGGTGMPAFGATVAAESPDQPFDATPSPDGATTYFITIGATPAVQSVPTNGGTPTKLHEGAPLVAPRGIATSTDGATLFVADPQAGVLALPASGGTPMVVAGTEALAPTALDVRAEGGADTLYLTGKVDGKAALLKIPAAGGAATTLASGAPFVDLDGVATTSDGYVYVCDRAAGGGSTLGRLFAVRGGDLGDLGFEFAPGTPCGIGLNREENLLLVSALDPVTGASQVLLIQNLDNHWVQPIEGSDYSGGVHCADLANVCTWAGKSRVYKVVTGSLTSSSIGGAGDVAFQ